MPNSPSEILAHAKEEKVHFLRLQFTDIDGIIKHVEVPESQFEKALDGQIMFDGSSIEGFTRIEESDMLLVPDMETYTEFLQSEILKHPSVRSASSTFVLQRIKYTTMLPLSS